MKWRSLGELLKTNAVKRYILPDMETINISALGDDLIAMLEFTTLLLDENNWNTSLSWRGSVTRIVDDIKAIMLPDDPGTSEDTEGM